MKRLSQVGLAFLCFGLVAPAAARADSVNVMNAVYETSFVRAAVDHEQATQQTQISIFSWCRRCSSADASPFLVNANLSSVPSGHDDGVNVVFNGGFAASFGGAMTLPVPAISSTTTPGSSSTPTITLPLAPANDADHDSGGAAVVSHGGGDIDHDGDHGSGGHGVDHVVAGVTSTGHGALSKTESVAATPEPATLFLLGTGLIGIISGRRALRPRN